MFIKNSLIEKIFGDKERQQERRGDELLLTSKKLMLI
jgi:hypothetical protein